MTTLSIARRTLSPWVLGLVFAATAALGPAPAASPRAGVYDLGGRALDPVAPSPRAPTVLVFTRTDCPISNRYAPELRRLHDRFSARGATFWLVYTDPAETAAAIRRHGEAFGFGFDALRDTEHTLVALAGATVTPEAAVFVAGAGGPQMVYRGRIDDRATAPGRTRAQPTHRDLADVLDAVTAGGAPAPRTTTAVGCFIPTLP
ncbi:MAG TPA: redoxin domain-containing protein [Vicinamibacteria bacterium]|nr:redoxin domain-containing protein [Vicinamibacteria bacterium]